MRLTIPLSRQAGPLFRQLYLGMREAILSGVLQSGEKLPSTRDLAEQLHVSRTVVLLAYDQLLSEGFVSGRSGSGTYVSAGLGIAAASRPQPSAQLRLARLGSAAADAFTRMDIPRRRKPALRYDFAYRGGDLAVFPFEMWRRILLRCSRKVSLTELNHSAAGGYAPLQAAICEHLRRARAVFCDPSQVIVVNGSQQALDLVARVLIERGDPVAMEEPGYQGTQESLLAAGARLLPVVVDREGLNPRKLSAKARLAFVTPSHQFPTGAILPLVRRLELLEWAKLRNAIIVEDDYDGEFRYEGQMLESLQGLDREGRVIYIGTFSRTIFPALRIGYLIAPKSLVPAFTGAKWLADRHTAALEQHTLAEFISSGMYERYLRRVRRRNAARRATLLESIAKYLEGRAEVTGGGAGVHIVLWPKRRVVEEAVIAQAAEHGVGIYGISSYCRKPLRRSGFLLGYSRLSESEIREGIRRLSQVLRAVG